MSENTASQDVKKINANQAFKLDGEQLVAKLNLKPGDAAEVIRALSARLASERLNSDEFAVMDNILWQLRSLPPGARMAMLKAITGDLSEDSLKARKIDVGELFEPLLKQYGAGVLRVVLSNAERTAKIMQRRDQAEQWRGMPFQDVKK